MAYADNSGFYFGAQAGGSLLSIGSINNAGTTSGSSSYTGQSDYSYSSVTSSSLGSVNGFSGVGAINLGYDFNYAYQVPVRAELSYTLRSQASKQTSWANGSASSTVNGTTTTLPSGYSFTQQDKIKAGMDTLMLNGYYDLHTSSGFTPYITAGVGLAFRTLSANQNTKTSYESQTGASAYENITQADTNFAWRAGLGVAYEINKNWIVDLSAIYIDAGKITATTNSSSSSSSSSSSDQVSTSAKLSSVDVLLGVRYTF